MKESPPTLSWLFFSFKGRIARQSFLLGAGFLLLPQIIVLTRLVNADQTGSEGGLVFWFLIFVAVGLATLWSLLALFLKRLHDLNLPGALCVLAVFSGINFLFFLFLALMPSKQETNERGPPPFPVDP